MRLNWEIWSSQTPDEHKRLLHEHLAFDTVFKRFVEGHAPRLLRRLFPRYRFRLGKPADKEHHDGVVKRRGDMLFYCQARLPKQKPRPAMLQFEGYTRCPVNLAEKILAYLFDFQRKYKLPIFQAVVLFSRPGSNALTRIEFYSRFKTVVYDFPILVVPDENGFELLSWGGPEVAILALLTEQRNQILEQTVQVLEQIQDFDERIRMASRMVRFASLTNDKFFLRKVMQTVQKRLSEAELEELKSYMVPILEVWDEIIRDEGRDEGWKQGRDETYWNTLQTVSRNLQRSTGMSAEQIAQTTGFDVELVRKALDEQN